MIQNKLVNKKKMIKKDIKQVGNNPIILWSLLGIFINLIIQNWFEPGAIGLIGPSPGSVL